MEKLLMVFLGLVFFVSAVYACCPGPCCGKLRDPIYSNLIKAKVPYKEISMIAQQRANMYKIKQEQLAFELSQASKSKNS